MLWVLFLFSKFSTWSTVRGDSAGHCCNRVTSGCKRGTLLDRGLAFRTFFRVVERLRLFKECVPTGLPRLSVSDLLKALGVEGLLRPSFLKLRPSKTSLSD